MGHLNFEGPKDANFGLRSALRLRGVGRVKISKLKSRKPPTGKRKPAIELKGMGQRREESYTRESPEANWLKQSVQCDGAKDNRKKNNERRRYLKLQLVKTVSSIYAAIYIYIYTHGYIFIYIIYICKAMNQLIYGVSVETELQC